MLLIRKMSRTYSVNIGPPAVFMFLAVLLVLGRIVPAGSIFVYVQIILSTAIVSLLFYIHNGRPAALLSVFNIVTFVALCLIWSFSTSFLFDPGFDSYAYHLEAIRSLRDGWDPFASTHPNVFVDSYPSGHWELQAVLAGLSGNLLAGSSLTVGLIVTVGLLSHRFFAEQFAKFGLPYRLIGAPLLALLVIGNPVAITQVQTHYVDAPLYLYGCGLLFLLLSDAVKSDRIALWAVAACIVLIVNTKLTGLFYAPVIIGIGLLAGLLLKQDRWLTAPQIKWALSRSVLYGVALLLGLLAVGFKPYVTNIRDHGHVVFPPPQETVAQQGPRSLLAQPAPVKFVQSVLSRTEYDNPRQKPLRLKVPGSVSATEMTTLRYDTRRGGFGPFFSLALIAAIAAAAVSLASGNSNGRREFSAPGKAIAAAGAGLLIASAFFPLSWWARFIPFAWLAVLLLAASTFCVAGSGRLPLIARLFGGLAVLSLFVNGLSGALGAALQVRGMYWDTEAAIGRMQEFEHVKLTTIFPDTEFKGFVSASNEIWAELLKSRGIAAVPVDRLNDCESAGSLNGKVFWCGDAGAAR